MRYLLFFLTSLASNALAAYLPPAKGKQVMVVSAQHKATEVGLAILKQGGNAVDAAVGVAYALAVVHPCCGNLGGGGFMLIHLKNHQNVLIDFREKAPGKISNKLFLKADGSLDKEKTRFGYLPVGVPGSVMGLNDALKKYGTMSLKRVMKPAIHLAKHGFVLEPGDIRVLNTNLKYFRKNQNVASIFLNHGKPYQAGDRLIQKQLAKTLYAISRKGSDVFYHGWIAKAIVQSSHNHGGVLSMKDFANYKIEFRQPIHCNYRGFDVMTAPPPSSGVILCEMLNILKAYPLGKLGYHSAASVNLNIEAMRYSFADRNTYLADPNFVKNPVHTLLSDAYAKKIRQKIIANKAGNSAALHRPKISINEQGNTTHFVVIDRFGNAVSVTTTLNSFFGSKVIANGTGFFLNDELDDFTLSATGINKFNLKQGRKNFIEPNKRPLSSMSPTIIFKNGKVFMLVGAAGGPTIITTILETIEHVIDDKMNINAALNSPRYHMQWYPDATYLEPFCLSKNTLQILQNMGYQFKYRSPFSKKAKHWGQGAAILVDPKTKTRYGANDNRSPAGLAEGY